MSNSINNRLSLDSIANFKISHLCMESYPCQHNCKITLRDGRTKKVTFSNPLIAAFAQKIPRERMSSSYSYPLDCHFSATYNPFSHDLSTEALETLLNTLFDKKIEMKKKVDQFLSSFPILTGSFEENMEKVIDQLFEPSIKLMKSDKTTVWGALDQIIDHMIDTYPIQNWFEECFNIISMEDKEKAQEHLKFHPGKLEKLGNENKVLILAYGYRLAEGENNEELKNYFLQEISQLIEKEPSLTKLERKTLDLEKVNWDIKD